MGKYLRHIPCPACGSSDALALYLQDEGHTDGTCFSCKKYFKPNEIEGTGMAERSQVASYESPVNLHSINDLPLADLSSRGIDAETVQYFGIRQSVSESTGEPDYWYFPEYRSGKLCGYKKRSVTSKEFSGVGSLKDIELFGQHLYPQGGRMLIITEGEIDAMSVWQMFKKQGKNYRVVSLPHGANSKHFVDNMRWVDSFEHVVLCMDQDDPGLKCANEIAGLMQPGKVRIMRFALKDANEMLLEGRQPDLIRAFYQSNPYRPEGTVGVRDLWEQVLTPPVRGLDWPWPSLTDKTYGRRRREIYGFGAGTGAGKSELFKEIQQHILFTEGNPIGAFVFEEEPFVTLQRLCGKILRKPVFTPDDFEREPMEEVLGKLEGKVQLYNHFGTRDWEEVKRTIRYWVAGLGIKDIFLDHLTALTPEQDDTNRVLGKIMSEMASLAQSLDCTIYFISHLSTPSGQPHEEGGRVTISQFRGSRTIGFWSHFLFGMERNQQADNELDRNTTTLRILKDRYTGRSTGHTIKLLYDHDTVSMVERGEESFDEEYE